MHGSQSSLRVATPIMNFLRLTNTTTPNIFQHTPNQAAVQSLQEKFVLIFLRTELILQLYCAIFVHQLRTSMHMNLGLSLASLDTGLQPELNSVDLARLPEFSVSTVQQLELAIQMN